MMQSCRVKCLSNNGGADRGEVLELEVLEGGCRGEVWRSIERIRIVDGSDNNGARTVRNYEQGDGSARTRTSKLIGPGRWRKGCTGERRGSLWRKPGARSRSTVEGARRLSYAMRG